jgi:hypothetical protein
MLVLSNSIDFRDLQVTAYRDDTLDYKFYPLPDAPRIRKDAEGLPIFLLTKYAFSDQDRENNPELPAGGGYLNLDVVFALTPEQEAQVRQRLQEMVAKEWNRRRNIDPESEGYRYRGPDAILASPQWVDGAVKFHVVNDANLITGKLSEGKPSMFGVNNAIFNATLTPAGATYFQKTLVDDDGTGIDLTPIQVEYELSFMRRLPPLDLWIYGNTTEIYNAVSELRHDYDSHFWSEDDFSTEETYTETLIKTETVSINIDTGEYAADSDEVEELRSLALGMLNKWIQENLFERVTKFDPTYPDIEDVYGKKADVYRLKTINQVVINILDIRLKQSSLVPFTIHPQATLESFFEGLTSEQIARHVREVDLEDDFFTTLDLNVKAFADYSQVRYVKVDLQYDGESGLKTRSLSFESNDDKAGNWNPRLNAGNREYRWRYEVAFKDDPEAAIVTPFQLETTRQLNINVGRPGELSVDVLAGQIDWEQLVEQVQVTLEYEDNARDIPRESATIILKKDSPSGNYQHWLYKPREKAVTWKAKYFLRNGQELEGETRYTTADQIVINDSFIDTLEVMVVPTGLMEYIHQVVVDLRYRDRSGYSAVKHYSISKTDFFAVWKVPLIDVDQRNWEWKMLVLYKDGTHQETGWQEMSGSQTLPVSWESPPTLEVIVNPVLVKFDQAPVVEVTLTYKGDVVNGESLATFVFEEKKKRTWTLRVTDEAVKDYDWEVTYYLEPEPLIKKGTSDKRVFLVPRITAA